MKLLIDMNLSPRWVHFFTMSGIEAVHWSALGSPNALDAEIIEFARSNGYVILTHDLDFSAILAAHRGLKPSVVQIRADDTSHDAIGPSVLRALRQMDNELNEGALLAVDARRSRLRLLPLRS